jgi:hypothetical protein
MNLSWHNGTGADGVLVLKTTGGAAPNTLPSQGVAYTVGSILGNATVALAGLDSSLIFTGLNDNTTLQFKIYSYTGNASSIAYLTSPALSGSQSTNAIQTPVANIASAVDTSSFIANWNTVGCANSYKLYVYTNNSGNNIAAWTFPTSGLSPYTDSTISNSNNYGSNGMQFSVNPSSTLSSVSGNGTQAASTSNWNNVGKYWQTIVNVNGYTNIKLSSVQYSSATGPKDFKIQYKMMFK